MTFVHTTLVASSMVRADSTPIELIPYALLGFGVVMAVLAILMAITALLGRIFGKVDGNRSAKKVEEGPNPSSAGLDREEMLVVAAAVASVVDQPHRIVSVTVKEK